MCALIDHLDDNDMNNGTVETVLRTKTLRMLNVIGPFLGGMK
jgi:hypothetical protein